VIVEKPLTGCFAPPATPRAEALRRALASGDEIIVACREAGVRLCHTKNCVYAPPIQRARRLLTAAGGPILRIVGEESHGGAHAPVVEF
jgi:predicted dehydrogenase